MSSIVGFLKGQLNILTLLMFGAAIVALLYRLQKRTAAKWLLGALILVFLLCSTEYLPRYLATKLERQYPPLDIMQVKQLPGKVYIHVLGSGCSLDSSLPANSRMGPVAQVRLAEAIRIYRQVNNSIIVCSGGSEQHEETQAEITRNAAILLGVDSARLEVLTQPLTTMEEAKALAQHIGTQSTVIIATDAIHMPRAMKFFKRQGFTPIAAPTNYRAPIEPGRDRMRWWPKINHLFLMDVVLHEYLGSLKEQL